MKWILFMKKNILLIGILFLSISSVHAQQADSKQPETKKVQLYGFNGANYTSSNGAIKFFFEKILKVEYCIDLEPSDKPCKSVFFEKRTLEESLKIIEWSFDVKVEKVDLGGKPFYLIKQKK